MKKATTKPAATSPAPQNPVTQTIEKSILDIKILAGDLDPVNTDRLSTILWDIESKSSALRSFILNHVVRKA